MILCEIWRSDRGQLFGRCGMAALKGNTAQMLRRIGVFAEAAVRRAGSCG
jgi:hypothetical protein